MDQIYNGSGTRATYHREIRYLASGSYSSLRESNKILGAGFRNEENEKTASRSARNRGKRSGRVTRIPTVTPWPVQPLPSSPPLASSPASPAPLAFHWPIIDPFANFQMLCRKRTRRQRDGNAHESESAGITEGTRAADGAVYIANEWFASNWSVKSTRPVIRALGVFLSSIRAPLSQRARPDVDSLRNRDWPPMERFAPQPILSTTKLQKMIDVGAVSRDLFRLSCRSVRESANERASYSCPSNVGPVPSIKRIVCCTLVMDHGRENAARTLRIDN